MENMNTLDNQAAFRDEKENLKYNNVCKQASCILQVIHLP